MLLGVDRALFVDGLAEHVEDAAQRCRTDRHADRGAGVHGSAPRARPSVVVMATARTQLLPRCCWTSTTSGLAFALDLDRVEDRGQLALRELDVDHWVR